MQICPTNVYEHFYMQTCPIIIVKQIRLKMFVYKLVQHKKKFVCKTLYNNVLYKKTCPTNAYKHFAYKLVH